MVSLPFYLKRNWNHLFHSEEDYYLPSQNSKEPEWTSDYLGRKAARYYQQQEDEQHRAPPPPPSPPPLAADRFAHLQAQITQLEAHTNERFAQLEVSNTATHQDTRSLLQQILSRMCGTSSSTAP